jgi:hypothetical protein
LILRQLNEVGIRAFRGFIERSFAGDAVESVPESLLNLEPTSEPLSVDIELDPLSSRVTSFELAKYLHRQLRPLPPEEVEGGDGQGNVGFWAAVSLFYFELLTPGFRRREAKAKTVNRYIPEVDTQFAAVRYYRHLIAGPYRLYRDFGEMSRPLLLGPAHQANALYNKITDSAFYLQTPCLVQAIALLYFETARGRMKQGFNDPAKPGSLPRLLRVVEQLDLTVDLLALDGKGLLDMLPVEFEAFRRS